MLSGWSTPWPGYWFLLVYVHGAPRAALALGHDRPPAGHGRLAERFHRFAGGGRPRAPDRIGDPAIRATLEWFHAFVASDFGDPAVGEAMIGRALASFRALGGQWGIAAALIPAPKLAMIRANAATGTADAEQSLEIFRELGDRWGQLKPSNGSGPLRRQPETTRADRLHHGDGPCRLLWPQAADALLGRSALRAGDLAQAREFETSHAPGGQQGDLPGHVFAELLGETERREGRLDVAETHIRDVLRMRADRL